MIGWISLLEFELLWTNGLLLWIGMNLWQVLKVVRGNDERANEKAANIVEQSAIRANQDAIARNE